MKRTRTRARIPETVGVLTIDRLAAGGDGVGRLDGLAVFVPRTAPGDVVQVAMTRHARLARGRVLQLLTPSPHRVDPACPHYIEDRCGGCQLQHLDVETQRLARRQFVQETLRRIGHRDVPLPSLHGGAPWHYRRRLTLTLVRAGGRWIGGLHPHDDPVRVFPLARCHVVEPAIDAAWQGVRPLLRQREPAMPDEPRLRLAIRSASSESGGTEARVVLLVQGGSAWPDAEAWGRAAGASVPGLWGAWWHPAGAQRPLRIWGGAGADADQAPEPLDEGPEALGADAVGAPSADEAVAFAQVNASVAAALRTAVLDAVRAMEPSHVVDAYAGSGALTALVASTGTRVTAIEQDPAGVSALRHRLEAMAVPGEVLAGRVEAVLPSVSAPAEVIVLNPPRRGVDARVCAWLASPAAGAVRRVVYVSCDPATLARDLARLPGWRVTQVACFDMFPQTAHVETVCTLDREEP